MPLNANIGGKLRSLENQERNFLTEDQVKHIYEKVELRDIINISTIKQEIDQDQELNKLADASEDINP